MSIKAAKTTNSLRELNTFGIEAQADKIVKIRSLDDLQARLPTEKPLLVLGGGSNMLFTQDWKGVVFKINIKGKEIVEDNNAFKLVKIGAGENWHRFVRWAVEQGLGGVENLSLIPGTVGAAPIQNIGAYGAELKDVFVELEAVSVETGDARRFTRQNCKFGYRDSVFKQKLKGQYIITSVTLRLRKNPRTFNTGYGDIQAVLAEKQKKRRRKIQLTPRKVSDAVIAIRQSKLPDPAVLGNSGSFFKNPEILRTQYEILKQQHPTLPAYSVERPDYVKIPAGWLIEQAGWKGKRVGNTGSHAQQALVLVNYGGATGAEVYQLALDIIADVREKFGVSLSPEVNII